MNTKEIKFVVLWGLPASGKTTYANCFNFKNEVRVVNVDGFMKMASKKDDPIAYIVDKIHISKQQNIVILDGLFTTNEVVKKLFVKLREKYSDCKFEIVFWEKDIESCLWNDKGRRKVDSKISIENLPLETPSKDLIKEFNVKLITKLVVRKPVSEVWINEVVKTDNKKLESQRWSLGGSYGNCYGETRSISGEAPLEFTEFDELLMRICPNVSFLQYKLLYNKTVTTKEEYEGDYYGGGVTYAKYVCDLEKLYELLVEMKIIQPYQGEM